MTPKAQRALDALRAEATRAGDDPTATTDLREALADLLATISPDAPTSRIHWLPIEHVRTNEYNPNHAGGLELDLLRRSITKDGITQPIVVTPTPDQPGHYTIVDGAHRHHVISTTPDLRARTHDLIPAVILHGTPAERMASTVRHNRARGTHQLDGMANLIHLMTSAGMTDHEISQDLGMPPEELTRLKHVTGFARLYADHEYSRAWLTKNQIKARLRYIEEHPGEEPPPT